MQNYVDFFVQDTWRLNRLTINPGLRYEQEKLTGEIIDNFKLKNNWAPRIGATYDLTGDAKTKVFGNFGLFYSRVPNDLAARALSSDNGVSRADYFDANLTRPIPNGTVTQTTATATPVTNHFALLGVSADVIDPNAKLSYVREFVFGVEREVMPNTTAGVRYINRRIPACARGRRELPDGRLRGLCRHHGRLRHRRVHPDEPQQLDADQSGAARCGAAVRQREVRRSRAQVRRGRVHVEPAHGEQLVDDGVVSVVAPARQLRGLLPRRQRSVRSGHLVAVRFPDQ